MNLEIYYWVVRKIRAAKDLNLINEIKNLNLRFNFPSKSARTFMRIREATINNENYVFFLDQNLLFYKYAF